MARLELLGIGVSLTAIGAVMVYHAARNLKSGKIGGARTPRSWKIMRLVDNFGLSRRGDVNAFNRPRLYSTMIAADILAGTLAVLVGLLAAVTGLREA